MKPPYPAFQLSSVSRRLAEKFLTKAYVAPVAVKKMVVPPKRVKKPQKVGLRRARVFWIPVGPSAMIALAVLSVLRTEMCVRRILYRRRRRRMHQRSLHSERFV